MRDEDYLSQEAPHTFDPRLAREGHIKDSVPVQIHLPNPWREHIRESAQESERTEKIKKVWRAWREEVAFIFSQKEGELFDACQDSEQARNFKFWVSSWSSMASDQDLDELIQELSDPA